MDLNYNKQKNNKTVQIDIEKIEEIIQGIWIEVLEYDKIGLDDDFYEKGGDSLLAVKLLELIRERVGISLEIADIFSYTTIRSQANYIKKLLGNKPKQSDSVLDLLTQLEEDDISIGEACEKLK